MNNRVKQRTGNILEQARLVISVKEARKLLGKKFKPLSDEEIEIIINLIDIVTKDYIQNTVPDFS